jgi:hypothetical protein
MFVHRMAPLLPSFLQALVAGHIGDKFAVFG